MGSIAKFRKKQVGFLAAAIMTAVSMPTAFADMPAEIPGNEGQLPKLNKIVEGVNPIAEAVTNDKGIKQMKVKLNADKGIIRWDTFNIGSKAEVNFSRPGSNQAWMVLNRVLSNDASEIYGSITSDKNGTVFLINPHGINFHKGASVDVGSFVASTLEVDEKEFSSGSSTLNFKQKAGVAGAKITNLGDIKASDDGMVAILAHQVVSGGDIVSDGKGFYTVNDKVNNKVEGGQVVMAAGKDISLELQYDDKTCVRINEKAADNGVKIVTPSALADFDYVVNASEVTGKTGYVLMKASDASRDVGSHLVCQTGTVTAKGMSQDEGGNIILQADLVNAGGVLKAEGKNAKIGIYGNSLVKAEASATDEGGEIDIDTHNGAVIMLAGANLSADKKVTTRSNHSVIVLDEFNNKPVDTKINVTKSDSDAGWYITASKVDVNEGVKFAASATEIELVKKVMNQSVTADQLSDKEKSRLKELADLSYSISNKVIGDTLANTNVTIKTDQFDGHYVFSKEGVEATPTLHYGEADVNGDNNIDVNADIVKTTGDKVTSLNMNAMGSLNLNADITTDEQKAEALNVTLAARGISGLIDTTTLNDPNNITYDEVYGDDYITVNNGERKITTWGKDNTFGTVTINSKVDSADAANHGSLTIKTGDAVLNADAGSKNALTKVAINATHDITTQAVTADTTVRMDAGNDININGTITGNAQNTENAVDLRAQKRFLNNVANSANAIKVGTGSNWKVYSETPYNDEFGKNGVVGSENFAIWGWDGKSTTSATGNRYIFKYNPSLTFTAKDAVKKYGEAISNTGWTYQNEMSGKFLDVFHDGHDNLFMQRLLGINVNTDSKGYPAIAPVGNYGIFMVNASVAKDWGYKVEENPGLLQVNGEGNYGDKPQMDNLSTSNLNGSASYTMAQNGNGASADRVLGLQSAELPFFNEKRGTVKLYGTYDVSVDPDKVTMEPTAKVLPEPDQPKNQYRELEAELVTENGSAKFKMTYNGSTLDIYPTDSASKALLVAGDGKKNVEIESKALFEAFTHMGISLDDLDGVYTHFEDVKVSSFRS